MNERIETLAKAAGYDMINKAAMRALGFDVEKFAQLIVKECVQVLDTCHVDIAEDVDLEDNNTWINATMNTTVNFCMGRVKQHFGVEE